MNLILNARDAMPTGGSLRIETADTTLTEADGSRPILEARPGSYVAVTVSDNGVGRAPGTVEQIFDPFYTTKGEHGTGLGLATVYGIVHQSHGDIEVRSTPGWGRR